MRSFRRKADEDTELDMVPIMNMFLVLIPFLLMSASFLHINAVNTSVPVHSDSQRSVEDQKSEIKITVILALGKEVMKVSATSDNLTAAELSKFDASIKRDMSSDVEEYQLVEVLRKIKTSYPKSDTVILVPESAILYDDIITAMDLARNFEQDVLFPNVVLSASLG
jgi:biopolymer transport protein ExbD